MLTIDRIRLFYGTMPCDLHFSYGNVTTFPYAVAEVRAGDWTGVGECLHPSPDVCTALGHTLLGRDALALDQLIPRQPFAWQISVHRELYSMALHDLVAKALGVPLHVLLGGLVRRRVPLMACMFPTTPDRAYDTARQFADQGFPALKLKNYGDAERDCALIRAARRAFPAGHLQSDPNCGYKSFAAAAQLLPRLAEAGLTAVEDPLNGTLEEYRQLLAIAPRPLLILDGPSRGDTAIGEVARLRPAEAVNLHPNMQGTFSDIRDRAAVTRLAGLGVEIGGTGYAGVGAWAHLHVAAVFGAEFPYGELGGYRDHGMPGRTSREPMPVQDGHAMVPEAPGHGGELDLDYLSRHATMEELT